VRPCPLTQHPWSFRRGSKRESTRSRANPGDPRTALSWRPSSGTPNVRSGSRVSSGTH